MVCHDWYGMGKILHGTHRLCDPFHSPPPTLHLYIHLVVDKRSRLFHPHLVANPLHHPSMYGLLPVHCILQTANFRAAGHQRSLSRLRSTRANLCHCLLLPTACLATELDLFVLHHHSRTANFRTATSIVRPTRITREHRPFQVRPLLRPSRLFVRTQV